MDRTLLFACVLLLFVMGLMCHAGSSGFTSSLTMSSSPDDTKLDSITNKSVLIFIAPWCGHCKKSMSEFLEASRKSSGQVVIVNSDDPKSADLLKKYNVSGFPTIISASGTKYTGTRDSSSIVEFANSI